MSQKIAQPTDSRAAIRDAVRELTQAVAIPPERNDLGRLAQMHSWCQSLANGDATPLGESGPALQAIATAATQLLEALILDEARQPEAGVRLLPNAVAALAAAADGRSVDAAALAAELRSTINGVATVGAPAAIAAPPAPTAAPAPVAPAPTTDPAPAGAGYVSEPLRIDLDEREHLDGFIAESREHLDAIEGALLEVEREPGSTDKINELFRPFHTIKGIAGFLNLRDINRLTHEVETILDMGRKNELAITPAIIDLIFAAIDRLNTQIAELGKHLANPSGDVVPQPDITEIMAQLRAAASGQALPAPARGEQTPAAGAVGNGGTAETTGPPTAAISANPDNRRAAAADGGAAPDGVEAGKGIGDASIRVDTTKLDALVDAVGELVIAQTMVNLSDRIRTDEKLQRDVSQVTKIVRDIQETAMAMRMIQIGHTFQRMRRLVRDVGRKAGKQVELAISGEETELDKNVIQAISDPLVHMVRNAVDHGVEAPAQRRAAGKPETGNVWLDAYHQGDSIVIEIRDDGRGMDPARLIAKGRERGLVGPDEQLTEQQAYQLIMAPGFSTAEQITDISGRGVGMDVVRRNVEQLRGKIDISSELGRGSTFRIRLPLTLAIIDGMLVRVGQERLIIPTILIEQSLRPEPAHVATVQRKGELLQVRGELCPLLQLGQLFGYTDPIDPCAALVIVTHCGDQKVGIVVDELIGQQQVVIKTLGERFKNTRGISGAAILGDGRVGLILEPAGLLKLHNATHTGAIRRTRDDGAREPVEMVAAAPAGAGERVEAGSF